MRLIYIFIVIIVSQHQQALAIQSNNKMDTSVSIVSADEIYKTLKIWTSSGKYEITNRRIISDKDGKIFTLDISMGSESYVYLMIPLGKKIYTKYKVNTYYVNNDNINLNYGVNVELPDINKSGIYVFKDMEYDTSNIDRISITGDAERAANSIVKSHFADIYGGIILSEVNYQIDRIGIFVRSKLPGSVHIVIRDICLFKDSKNNNDFSISLEKITKYKARMKKYLQNLSTEFANDIKSFHVMDEYTKKYINLSKSTFSNLHNNLLKGIFPTETELSSVESINKSVKYLNKYHNNLENKKISFFDYNFTKDKDIFEDDLPIDYSAINNIELDGARNSYILKTFIIYANDNLNNIALNCSAFTNSNTENLPAFVPALSIVKEWYQSGKNVSVNTNKRLLVKELLVNNDELLKVDYLTHSNYVKSKKTDNSYEYVNISSNQNIYTNIVDSNIVLPFNLKKYKNKLIFIKAKIPSNIEPGRYRSVCVATNNRFSESLYLNLTILPFSLFDSELDYAMYYRGKLPNTKIITMSSESKVESQYRDDMLNIMNHGIEYPTIQIGPDLRSYEATLKIRQSIGMKCSKLFIQGASTDYPQTLYDLNHLLNKVNRWRYIAEKYGCSDIYMYGVDEAKGHDLERQKNGWDYLLRNNYKIYAACYNDAIEYVADKLTLPVLSGQHNKYMVAKWSKLNKKVYSYGNPQAGLENPTIYRINYGLALWQSGYSGAMIYAYQHEFGDIWNDFDDVTYRDHVFSYPTMNGHINTLEFEGLLEGIQDVKYLSVLLKLIHNDPENEIAKHAMFWLNNNNFTKDLDSARNQMIDYILELQSVYSHK